MNIYQADLFNESKITFEYILQTAHNWEQFKSKYGSQLRPTIIKEVEKMLNCGNRKGGFATFICSYCGETKTIPFSCKSRPCTRCGKKYADVWSKELNTKLLNTVHRHLVLTIPELLWPYFIDNFPLQKILMDTAGKTIRKVLYQQNKDKIKIMPGLILIIHPFGDDLKPNFHIHVLATAGGLSQENQWIKLAYIHYAVIRKIWQYEILTALRQAQPQDQKLNALIDLCFTNYKQGFVIFAEREIIGDKYAVLRYVSRYMRHPAISNRRITGYDGEFVYFIYEQSGQTQQKKLPKLEFIYQVLQHIPDKHFKTVRRQGLYARRSAYKYQIAKDLLLPPLKNNEFPEFNWRQNIIKFTGKDPLFCPKCGQDMVLFQITYFDGTQYKTIGGWDWLVKNLELTTLREKIPSKNVKEPPTKNAVNPTSQGEQLYLC